MSARTDALAIRRYIERQPGGAVTHAALAAEFARREYDPPRFTRALRAALVAGLVVGSADRDGVEVPR